MAFLISLICLSPAFAVEEYDSDVVDRYIYWDEGIRLTGPLADVVGGQVAAHGLRRAFLKERSPSCGVRNTHVDGTLVEGPGVTAELLARNEVEVTGVEGRRPS